MSSERLPTDQRAGDWPIDVEIADIKVPSRLFDMRRCSRVEASRQGIRRAVSQSDRIVE
jgi:hypothetical protein